MTTTEILALAKKTLHEKYFDSYVLSLNNRNFTAMRIISETCLEKVKDALIENAIRGHCDSVVTSNYKLANDLMNETLEFIIVNSEVN